jgi:hypothetical protein
MQGQARNKDLPVIKVLEFDLEIEGFSVLAGVHGN